MTTATQTMADYDALCVHSDDVETARFSVTFAYAPVEGQPEGLTWTTTHITVWNVAACVMQGLSDGDTLVKVERTA